MSPPNHKQPPSEQPDQPDGQRGETASSSDRGDAAPVGGGDVARLVHELANLLDGKLRHVRMAAAQLRQQSESPPGKPPREPEALAHLDTAGEAMQQMAAAIHAWKARGRGVHWLHHRARTLGQAVAQAVQLMTPAAEMHGIALSAEVSPAAAALPAGPIFAVLNNAVRNSIEAISESPSSPQPDGRNTVQVRAAVRDQHVERGLDDGPGLHASLLDDAGQVRAAATTKADGQGVGLTVCREIAGEIGGELHLRNREGGGAELLLRYPLGSTEHHAPER